GGLVQLEPARRDGVAPPTPERERQLAEPLAERAERRRLGVGQPPPLALVHWRGGKARERLPGGVALGDDRRQRAQVRGRRPVVFTSAQRTVPARRTPGVVTPETGT